MDHNPEAGLITRVLGGDRLAARELYDTHARRVYRVIYRLVGDDVLAEEFTQDTFVKVFRGLAGFRGNSQLGTWIHSVAVTTTMNGLRTLRRRSTREFALDTAADLPAPNRTVEPDLKDRLNAAIDALPEKFRVPVVLHDIEGFTHAEIARMLGVPEGTCKTRLMHGRAKLRQVLAPFKGVGGTEAAV
ncbi:MAG: sigma-70 family RNA polymerase sigma factor [Gemmatimonadales bacterium]|nr:sigma-70 family RNA polymerase sigma factor [Gemmatimonadales bacterium]